MPFLVSLEIGVIMKLSYKSALFFGLLSSAVMASEPLSLIQNIDTFKTELSTLSIQNISSEKIEIDIYGETVSLLPASGIKFECSGYENIALQIKNNDHDFFEVPCQSRVVINESFKNQYSNG